MSKRSPRATSKSPVEEPLHPLTVRIPKSLADRMEAYSYASSLSYRVMVESAIRDYLKALKGKLEPDQRRKLMALLPDE